MTIGSLETAAEAKVRRAEEKLHALDSRIVLLEHRVEEVEMHLQGEVHRSIAADNDLKELVVDLRNSILELTNKNHIAEFVADNWKYIVLWIVITAGGDVGKLLETLKVLGH